MKEDRKRNSRVGAWGERMERGPLPEHTADTIRMLSAHKIAYLCTHYNQRCTRMLMQC
jgi:hypothetical protein